MNASSRIVTDTDLYAIANTIAGLPAAGPLSGDDHQAAIDGMANALDPWVRITRRRGCHDVGLVRVPLTDAGLALVHDGANTIVTLSQYDAITQVDGTVLRVPPTEGPTS
ncbi:hypothetical protein LuPra_03368 [Luteitalea pratensis]|uniref:Uncharacterized protein n=1 Tax=Luteitalea pratensis TaxID=1855912 RepID=A0A143PPT2_LUTPR|nr:hypothetical protein [Luteitalea pratensis]AMY10140.1 hypothetical protein LuPra_03368 [Luteitalea pratensis]